MNSGLLYIDSVVLATSNKKHKKYHDMTHIVDTSITHAEFNTIPDEHSRFMLKNAHQAITLTESWGYMRTFSSNSSNSSNQSFMFSNSPTLSTITNKMSQLGYDGHSGSSFGWTMRQMEFLAKNGKQAFLRQFTQFT